MSERGVEDRFLLVGTVLERKYRVDRPVAEGGFGIVYAGHHTVLDAPIAIKVLKRVLHLDDDAWAEQKEQFLSEARTLARITHAGVVRVLDAGITTTEAQPDGVPWIVMEWMAGETLSDDLAKRRGRGGRSAKEALALLRPVIEALGEAHELGIAHRDLKPSNVMLGPEQPRRRARVLDFGIAKTLASESASDNAPPLSGQTTTESARRVFTAAAAAPEQLAGTRTGPWTDVHALGLLFTELLTDAPPYPIGDVTDHIRAVFDASRPTPGKGGVDVGEWEPILEKALALKPQDRYANANELLAALDAVELPPKSGLPPSNAPPSSSEAPGPISQVARTVDAPANARTTGDRDREVHSTGAAGTMLLGEGNASARAPATKHAGGRKRTILLVAAALLASLAIALGVKIATRSEGRVDGANGSTPSSTPRCSSHTACTKANHGAASACVPDVGCVARATSDCEVLADARALASDDTVWIGAMFPKTGADATSFGISNARAIDLARRDFVQTMSSTPGAPPFGVVSCDDDADPKRVATHLASTGAVAVIGFHSSVEAMDLATSVFLPKKILTIAALNTNPLVTRVPSAVGEPRLVWRTTYSSANAAEALSALVEMFDRGSGRSPNEEKGTTKVALLRPKHAAGAAFSETVFQTLRFNGKSALENGYAFREMTFDPESADRERTMKSMVDDLVRFAPHAILYSGPTTLINDVFAPVEAKWPKNTPRPRYASVALLPKELLDFIGKDADRRKRFFGVTPVSSTPANARFVMHYNETFPDPITRTIAPNSSYDAFYLVAYAAYASPRKAAVTGPSLSSAIARLVPSAGDPQRKPIDVGLSSIFDAYSALTGGASIDLSGATGPLDFDLASGEAPFDQAILCAGVDDDGRAFDGIESGLVYTAKTKKLEGALRCP